MKFDTADSHRGLDSYLMASIIRLATIRFCERLLNRRNDPCGRQYDQMTQAARSGMANIIEGLERSATSKETEMKLTDVAKASLGKLRGDFETWLMGREALPWKWSDADAQAVFSLRLDRPDYSDDVGRDCCAHILARLKRFAKGGGFREKLTAVRTAAHAGRNAGRDFWGCTGYPEYRGVLHMEKKVT